MKETDKGIFGESNITSLKISESKAKIFALKNTKKKRGHRFLLLSDIDEFITVYSFTESTVLKLEKKDFLNNYYYFGARFSNELYDFNLLPIYLTLDKKSKENHSNILAELSLRYCFENSSEYKLLIEADFLGKIYYDDYHQVYYFQINADQVVELNSGHYIQNLNKILNDSDNLTYVMNGLKSSFDILHSFKFDEDLIQKIIDSNPSFDRKEYNPQDEFKFKIKDGVIFNKYFSLSLSKVLNIEYYRRSRGETYFIYFKYSNDYTERKEVSFTEFKEIQKEFHKINRNKEEL